jgi:hypothetical protein
MIRAMRPVLLSERILLAALALGASAIHFAVVPEHSEEFRPYGSAFFVLALVQLVAAIEFIRSSRLRPRFAAAIGVASLGAVIVWIVSRTVGLPTGPQPWTPEAVGLADVVSCALEIGLVVVLADIARRREGAVEAPSSGIAFPAVRVALALLAIYAAAAGIAANGSATMAM